MGICLDQVHIDPPVILAPMSGVTDLPFRRLVRRLGGGLVVSEMIASREMLRAAQRMRRSSTDCAEEWPMVVQLAGDDPGVMADAARLNVDRGAAVIDINFGCPAKKVVNKACGAAMMREPDLATRRLHETGDGHQDGGLSRAARAEEGEERASRDRERDVVDRGERAVELGDRVQRERVREPRPHWLFRTRHRPMSLVHHVAPDCNAAVSGASNRGCRRAEGRPAAVQRRGATRDHGANGIRATSASGLE